jgi:peptidoglycan hydrolase-like protein with peptidoglycan-binding domain
MGIRSGLLQNKTTQARAGARQPFFLKQNRTASTDQQNKFFSPKLAIGAQNDKYEREADSMAKHVVSTLNHGTSTPVQRKCEACEKEEKLQRKPEEEEKVQMKSAEEEDPMIQKKSETDEEEKDVQLKSLEEEDESLVQRKESPAEEEEVQMKSDAGHANTQHSLNTQLANSAGSGRRLPAQTRNQMENSFGADFSKVSIHTDNTAVQMNEQLHAHAFTHGSDIYFNKGKYNPASTSGKELLAHELTHVVQQNSEVKRKRIQRKIVFGSGYAGFPSVPAEVAKAKAGKWNPTTVDFSTNAGRSGGGDGAKDLPELIGIVGKQGKGSIKQLGIIGHSNAKAMGLSGDVHTQGVPLRGVITEDTLKANKAKIDAVKDRFAAGASIVLYSCNSGGISNGLADVVSEAFGVCVKGFKNDVLWCITFNESPLDITSRGNVFYENPNDPLAGAGVHPSCANFHKKVLDLTPDVNSCKGVPKPAEKKCVSPQDIPILQTPTAFQLASFTAESGLLSDFPKSGSRELEGLKLMDGLDKNDIEKRSRVSKMQQRLNHHGAGLSPDGIFGNNTVASLNEFQSKLGLSPSAVVDSQTADALMMPSIFPGEVKVISQVEGLKLGDGLTFGTFNLRPRVSRLQQLLTIHGSFTKTDGMFGPKTKSALNIFQAAHDLTTTDEVDGSTADALEGRTPNSCPFGQIPLTTA